MKIKKVKIIVEGINETNKRWKKALKGKIKINKNEDVISVPNWEVLGKVLSPPRLMILEAVLKFKPNSIAELSRILKKNFKNIHSDVKFLAELGLLELREEGKRKTLVPIAKFTGFEFDLAA